MPTCQVQVGSVPARRNRVRSALPGLLPLVRSPADSGCWRREWEHPRSRVVVDLAAFFARYSAALVPPSWTTASPAGVLAPTLPRWCPAPPSPGGEGAGGRLARPG